MLHRLAVLLLASTVYLTLRANHYAGANILYTCDGTGQYAITLQIFLDCSGANIIPQTLSFQSDCGSSFTVTDIPVASSQEVSQLCPSQLANSTCNGGPLPGMQLYEFTTMQALSPCDGWKVSWNICCRSGSLNLVGNTGTYVETRINTATELCGASPDFTQDVVPYVCLDQPVNYAFTATDADGDSLVYSLVGARFYNAGAQPATYNVGYSAEEPIPGVLVDATTGQINFTPTVLGNYFVVIQVNAYNDAGELTGTVERDIIFIVYNCANSTPDPQDGDISNLTGSSLQTGDYSLAACGNGTFCFDAVITDADAIQTLTLTSNVGAILPGATLQVSGTNPATATICWDGQGLGAGSYNFNITAADDACPQPAVQVYTYTLVLSPAPNAGQNTVVVLCGDEPPANLTDLLNGDPDDNGTWSETGPGEYTYVVSPIGDCPADSAVLVLTLVSPPNAGTDNTVAVCSDVAAFSLVDLLGPDTDAGGTWTGPLQTNGIYDPAVNTPGLYCYTVVGTAPCSNDQACVVVTEVPAPDAGVGSALSLCPDDAPIELFAQLGGTPQAGGTWVDPLGDPTSGFFIPGLNLTGAYCYVLPGSESCANDTACVDVTILEPNDPICLGTSLPDHGASDHPVIYPQPSSGTLYISGMEPGARIDVIDLRGRVVISLRNTASTGLAILHLPSELADGPYLLHVRSEKQVTSTRFVLAR